MPEPRSAPNGLRVVHVVCTEAFAGAERYVQETAIEMAGRGCRVTVVGGARDTMLPRLAEHGVTWMAGSTRRQAFRALGRVEGTDVVVTHMTDADLVGAVFGLQRRLPVVSIRHFAARRGSSPAARLGLMMLRRRFAAQIAISHYVADAVEGSSEVVHSGVRVAADVDDSARSPVVLVLQRLAGEKHTEVALRAWAVSTRPAQWRMTVAGDGPEAPALKRLAVELGVAESVDFAGFQADVGRLLADASMLFASAPSEPFGLSVVEAMAYGLPVIAAAGGGHLETVGDVDGASLFPPDDVDAAAQRLTALMADPVARSAYGRALRDRQLARFTIAGQVTASLAILEQAAGAHRRSRAKTVT